MGPVGDLETQNQTQKPEVLQSSSPESDGSRLDPDQSIAEAIRNVELEQTQNWIGEDKLGDDLGVECGSKDQYPLRPYAEDCSFYVRNGYCKFGISCKFNHPVKKRAMNQGAREMSKDELVEQASNTECKYYRTAAGCKFGETCRYRHQSELTEKPPELNFLGLPLREGVIVCDFYLRNGSCGYGATCKFHHPEPTDNSCKVTPTLEPMGELHVSSANHNVESNPSQQLGTTSQPALASWSSHLMSDETVSYVDTHLSNAPMMDSVSGEVDVTYEWNGSQAAAYPEEDPWQINSPDNLVNRNLSTYNQHQIELDEFPQRPGQPDCDFYMRTGNCKYGFTCRYHHPKIQYSKFPEKAPSHQSFSPKFPEKAPSHQSFSPKLFYPQNTAWQINSAIGVDIFKKKTDVSGYHQPKIEVAEFPERPGEPDCGYYMKTGDCKYRSACKFHHPKENQVSTSPVCSLSDKGLPLRPDEKICWHYEQYGICKFGRSCLFHHPVDYSPSIPVGIPVGLQSPVPSSSYGTACEGTAMTGSAAGSEILIS